MTAQRTRIKICGIRTLVHAQAAIAAGADALGFVFYPRSPRDIKPEAAAAIIAQLPPLVTTIALVVDQLPKDVEALVQLTGVGLVQYSGDESPECCEAAGVPYIKAVRETGREALIAKAATYRGAKALLVDAAIPGEYGGTGHTVDWEGLRGVAEDLTLPLILAGGLNASNVRRAIDVVQPYAVDVSSGVEVRRGEKDVALIEGFVRAVG
jgi:phosphoribosylanthranilate isomerase